LFYFLLALYLSVSFFNFCRFNSIFHLLFLLISHLTLNSLFIAEGKCFFTLQDHVNRTWPARVKHICGPRVEIPAKVNITWSYISTSLIRFYRMFKKFLYSRKQNIHLHSHFFFLLTHHFA
jgi:hypothetical protein